MKPSSLVLGALGTLLRLAWVLAYQPVPVSDFSSYEKLGRSIAAHLFGGLPDGFTLGYPLFLSLFYRVGLDNPFILTVQAVLGGLTCALVAEILIRRVSRLAAWFGGGLAVLAPGSIFYCSILGSEILSSFLLVSSMLFLLVAVAWRSQIGGPGGKLVLYAASGLSLAAATAVRSMVLHLGMVAAVLLVFRVRRSGKRLLGLVVFCLAFYSGVWCYGQYNQAVRGYFRISARPSARMVWLGTQVESGGGWIPGAFLEEAEEALSLRGRDRVYLRHAVKNIVREPATFLHLVGKKFGRTFECPDTAMYWNFQKNTGIQDHKAVPRSLYRRLLCWYQRVLHVLLLSSFGFGLWGLFENRLYMDRLVWSGSLVVLVYFSLIVAATIGDNRFQIPFIPIACLFIASSPLARPSAVLEMVRMKLAGRGLQRLHRE